MQSSFANCKDLLHLTVQKRLNKTSSNLFSPEISKTLNDKQQQSLIELSKYRSLKDLLEIKWTSQSIALDLFIKSNLATKELRENIRFIRDVINDPRVALSWLNNLYADLVVQTYLSKDASVIQNFEKDLKFSEELMINLIVERVAIAGFSPLRSEVMDLHKTLRDVEFAKILQQKKLFIDRHFSKFEHGQFVHLFQMDLLVYAYRKSKRDPRIISEIYQWFGENMIYEIDDYGRKFKSLDSGWGAIFDSIEGDLSSPEEVNEIYKKIFNLD